MSSHVEHACLIVVVTMSGYVRVLDLASTFDCDALSDYLTSSSGYGDIVEELFEDTPEAPKEPGLYYLCGDFHTIWNDDGERCYVRNGKYEPCT